jgi:tetratricopeptide (TPR) repeat protein
LPDLQDRLSAALAGRYVLERELGRGGMATVYLAEDRKHRRPVALKVLHPELAATLGPERFLREIEVTAGLDHPHILPVLDSGDDAGVLWYTMPFVQGESLRDRLRRETQLPVDEAVRIAREVADGLQYAHQHGVVHRDIKPENILLAHGHARVADFGVAQAVERAGGDRLTGTGLAIGTPLYMSPEQAGLGGEVDGRSDLYSLGCVLYEMLGGEPPFTGPTPQAIIAKRLSGDAPALRHLRPNVPPGVNRALTRALATVPADRFASIAEFALALVPDGAAPSAPRLSVAAILGLYGLTAIAVFGVIRLLTSTLGLPAWVVPSALVLLLVGLPIMLATAVLQGRYARQPSTSDGMRRPGLPYWLTWRRALWGGGLAFAGLGVATAAYMTLRALGIGPVGTLQAAGVLKERERLLLADFGTRQVDSSLSEVLTEVFRIDLAQSPAMTLVPSAQVAEVLGRMQRPATARLDPALAREVAIREGIKGVVTGEIARAGGQYVLSAQLISAPTGEILSAHRETAEDSTGLIAAVDRLSGQLRAKVGESLKSVERAEPLEQVSTASLGALRQYTRALHVGDRQYEFDKAIALLREAIAMDSGFAMAYRTMAIYQWNMGDLSGALESFAGALHRRDRLTERDRYLTLGDYHHARFDPPEAIAAYEELLVNHPEDREALNNLANLYAWLRRYQEAESLFERAVGSDSFFIVAHTNLIMTQLHLRKWPEAWASFARASRLIPHQAQIEIFGVALAGRSRDFAMAQALIDSMMSRYGTDPGWRGDISAAFGEIAATRGRIDDARRHWKDAMAATVETGSAMGYLFHAVNLAGVLTVAAGEPAKGIHEVEQALAKYPLDALKPVNRPYPGLASFYALVGKSDRARALLSEYERLVEPRLRRRAAAELDLVRGRLAAAAGDFAGAVSWHQRAAQRGATPAFALPDLAQAYDLAGQTDSAIAVYQRYLITPDINGAVADATYLALILRRLGQLYEEGGERDKAREYYSRFIDLWKECDRKRRPRVEEAQRRLAVLNLEPR